MPDGTVTVKPAFKKDTSSLAVTMSSLLANGASSVPNSDFTASVSLTMPDSKASSLFVIFAAYDSSGRCLSVWTSDVSGSEGAYTASAAFTNDGSINSVQAFLIDRSSFAPLSAKLTITK